METSEKKRCRGEELDRSLRGISTGLQGALRVGRGRSRGKRRIFDTGIHGKGSKEGEKSVAPIRGRTLSRSLISVFLSDQRQWGHRSLPPDPRYHRSRVDRIQYVEEAPEDRGRNRD